MKVAYYVENPGMSRMTALSVASLKKAMPAAEVIQMSPERLPTGDWADTRVVTPEEGDFFVRRVIANAMLGDGEILYPDSDTIFHSSVEHVFDPNYGAFDVALPQIADPDVRYSAGIVFSRVARFWSEQAVMKLRRTDDGKPFTTDLLRFFTKFVDAWDGLVWRLDESRYERVPKNADDRCHGACIVHYRGPRKKWMPGYTGWPIETVFHNV
jgi:hypothetical protein